MSAPDSALRLRAPADPRLGVTVRRFVASAARFLGIEPDVGEDLRLAASEIFAAATAAGGDVVEVRIGTARGGVDLTVTGVPDLDGDLQGLPRTRRDLLDALFPGLTFDNGTVVIRATADHPDLPGRRSWP